ncbi:hypothetical protein EI94DRAFT_887400 [Lactarius quietus]|nr:hypothetical protein EI94DRAFT_887400 [Lactarius quietus]
MHTGDLTCPERSLEVTRHIGIEQDQASRVMGRCIGALVVNNVTARKKSHIGEKALACLSAILGANRRDVKLWLTQPGTIELVNMVFFAFSDIGFLSTDAVPSYVLDVVSQTFKILSNALPAEFEYQLQLDQTHALVVIPTGTSPILGDMFKNLAFRCLINLWRCVRTYNQPGKSVPLPSYILTFVGQAAMTGRIGAESDVAVRLVGRCIEALVVKKLVAGVKSRTDSTSQIRNEDLLVVPTAVDLASMVSFALGDVGSLVTSAVPSEVLDVVQQTLQPDQSFDRINTRDFSRIVASRLHSLLQVCMSGMSPFTNKVRRSCLRLFLKSLWNCVRAYHQLGASNPLPPYFPRTFATPGRCFQALVVTKLAADFKSRTVRLGDQELVAYLAAILGADPRVVNGWLLQPGAIDHMGLFFLAFSEVGTVRTSWISGIEKSHVEDVVKQTFSILSRALPLRLNAELWPDWAAPEVHVFLGQFIPLLHNRLEDLLKRCTIEALPLTSTARTEYLKTLWYYGIACHHLHTPSWSTWDFFPIHFITPQISRFIHTDNNPVSRVIGRCFVSLVLNRFATKFNSFGDRELVCLSAILGTEKRRAIDWLFQPGVVQLVNMVSVVLGETVCALTQDLPADLKVELPLHSVNTLMNTFDGPTESIIVPTLLDLFKMCTLQTLPLPEEIRTSCLQLCLTALWHRGKVLHQLGASQQLLPDFLDLSDLEITRHILTEQHRASRVMGRCVEALVINLAARIKSCSNSTVQNRDEAIGRLSAFHGTENRNVTLWLSQPGAIELANMVSLALGEIGSLAADTDPFRNKHHS